MKAGSKLMLCMVNVVASIFDAKPKRLNNKTNTTAARTRDETIIFLSREHQFAGSIRLQPFESEYDAHLAAAQRYLYSSVKTRREVTWRVYQKQDKYYFTYPNVGKENNKCVGLPRRLNGREYQFASDGLTHFDGSYHFCGQNWHLVTQQKCQEHSVKLYLAMAKDNAEKLTLEASIKQRWKRLINEIIIRLLSGEQITTL